MNKNILVIQGSIAIAVVIFLGSCFFIIDPGFTAIHLRMGQMIEAHTTSGMYFKYPLIDSIITVNNRILKSNIETVGLTKDLQRVDIGIAINYRIKNALELYQKVGTQYDTVILNPFAQESVKAVVAKFTAEDLIQFRHNAKDAVFNELKDRLSLLYIELIDFNFIHLDFTQEFIHAVENKQIAEQQAKTSKNLTEKVHQESIQAKLRSDAEAYSLQIKKEMVTAELIELRMAEAFIKAVEKWDGQLPRVMLSPQGNMLDVSSLMKS